MQKSITRGSLPPPLSFAEAQPFLSLNMLGNKQTAESGETYIVTLSRWLIKHSDEYMWASKQLRTTRIWVVSSHTVAFPSGRKTEVPLDKRLGVAKERVWTMGRWETSFAPAGNRTPVSRSRNP
jgi:hypothetical protein